MKPWRILGTALLGALALALAVGCGDDDPDDGSKNGVTAEITTCAQGCTRIADCLGFADELFGKDEAACLAGCAAGSVAEQDAVLTCLGEANCTQAAIATCVPGGD